MSSVKFITAAPLASAYGFGYFESLLITSIGGIIGVSVFFIISKAAIKAVYKAKETIQHHKEHELELAGKHPQPSKKRIFTWKNKIFSLIK